MLVKLAVMLLFIFLNLNCCKNCYFAGGNTHGYNKPFISFNLQ
jgi:hypothetical protein